MQRNNYTSPDSLPLFMELQQKKEASINSQINNLKINDVKEDVNFKNTSEVIKKSILIESVEFGEPKFIDHDYEERNLTMEHQLMGVSRNNYYHEIEVPFTGSTEVFKYRPMAFSISSSDRGILLPNYNSLTVYVELSELNPLKAINEAETLLSMTKKIVESNNANLTTWNISMSQHIEQLLQSKREELIKNFGK